MFLPRPLKKIFLPKFPFAFLFLFTHIFFNWNHLNNSFSFSLLIKNVTTFHPYLEKGFTNHTSILNLLGTE